MGIDDLALNTTEHVNNVLAAIKANAVGVAGMSLGESVMGLPFLHP